MSCPNGKGMRSGLVDGVLRGVVRIIWDLASGRSTRQVEPYRQRTLVPAEVTSAGKANSSPWTEPPQ